MSNCKGTAATTLLGVNECCTSNIYILHGINIKFFNYILKHLL